MRQWLNKRVLITSKRSGSRYAGVLSGFKEGEAKFCLTNLAIVNRQGAYTVSGSRQSRWFMSSNFVVCLEADAAI